MTDEHVVNAEAAAAAARPILTTIAGSSGTSTWVGPTCKCCTIHPPAPATFPPASPVRKHVAWTSGMGLDYDGWLMLAHSLNTMDVVVQPYGGPSGNESLWLFEVQLLTSVSLKIRTGYRDGETGLRHNIPMTRVVILGI